MAMSVAVTGPGVAVRPRTRVDHLAQLLTRAVPAGFFTGLIVLKNESIQSAAAGLFAGSDPLDALRASLTLAFLLLSAAFYLLIATMFVIRGSARGAVRGLWPTVLALGGTLGAGPLAMMPIVHEDLRLVVAADLMMAFGMAGCCLTLTSLGRCFGIRPCARGVVTGGVYRWVRHPLYLFEALVQVGTLMLVFSPTALLVFGAFVFLQYGRTLQEERVLVAAFPEYVAYRARTARFIPGVL